MSDGLPPYIVHEFTATSRRHARMKLYIRADASVVDVTWNDEGHTEQDEEEASVIAAEIIGKQFPKIQAVQALNITENDEQKRRELISSVLVPGWMERN